MVHRSLHRQHRHYLRTPGRHQPERVRPNPRLHSRLCPAPRLKPAIRMESLRRRQVMSRMHLPLARSVRLLVTEYVQVWKHHSCYQLLVTNITVDSDIIHFGFLFEFWFLIGCRYRMIVIDIAMSKCIWRTHIAAECGAHVTDSQHCHLHSMWSSARLSATSKVVTLCQIDVCMSSSSLWYYIPKKVVLIASVCLIVCLSVTPWTDLCEKFACDFHKTLLWKESIKFGVDSIQNGSHFRLLL